MIKGPLLGRRLGLFSLEKAPVDLMMSINTWRGIIRQSQALFPCALQQNQSFKTEHKMLSEGKILFCQGDRALAQTAQRAYEVSSVEIFGGCVAMVLGNLLWTRWTKRSLPISTTLGFHDIHRTNWWLQCREWMAFITLTVLSPKPI